MTCALTLYRQVFVCVIGILTLGPKPSLDGFVSVNRNIVLPFLDFATGAGLLFMFRSLSQQAKGQVVVIREDVDEIQNILNTADENNTPHLVQLVLRFRDEAPLPESEGKSEVSESLVSELNLFRQFLIKEATNA